MLNLKRRAGECIVINEQTVIRILRTGPGGCQIGIEAPQSEHIRRGEIAPESEQIMRETAEAIGVV
ncbi:MAG: carbon storage regulator [Fuerstiella sp.]|jgi:carbon storage regulator CsrA|nr:carbon storage regulator [Fuerstiella sp.]MCP4510490.1 carbon storage regulator [Fuerstiella sp.]